MSLTFSKISTGANDSCEPYHVAKVIDYAGRFDKFIYYTDNSISCREEINSKRLTKDICKYMEEGEEYHNIKLTTKQYMSCHDKIMAKIYPKGEEERKIYNYVTEVIEAVESKRFYTPGIIEVIPRGIEKQQDRLYLAAQSGAGKTYFIVKYGNNYLVIYPNNKVFLFSAKEQDETIDGKIPNLRRVALNKELALRLKGESREEQMQEYSNSLIIFDDQDTIGDKIIKTEVKEFKNAVLRTGRQYGISVISVTHKLLAGQDSIVELQQATHIVMFPKCGIQGCKEVLKTYCGYGQGEIDKVLDAEGKEQRWICVARPNIVITEKYIKILDR